MTPAENRPEYDLGTLLRRWGPQYSRTHAMPHWQRRMMRTLAECRTAALGGHLERCDSCGHERPAYNSCGDRHCPTCQGKLARKWLQDRLASVLNTPYFHCIFTIPDSFNVLVPYNERRLYNVLFVEAKWHIGFILGDLRVQKLIAHGSSSEEAKHEVAGEICSVLQDDLVAGTLPGPVEAGHGHECLLRHHAAATGLPPVSHPPAFREIAKEFGSRSGDDLWVYEVGGLTFETVSATASAPKNVRGVITELRRAMIEADQWSTYVP